MTDDRTPLQRLDDAIHDFAEATGHEDGTVGGWALTYELSTITAEPGILPLRFSAGYALGPATSPATAAGLANALAALCQAHTITALTDEDDDDQ